MAIYSWMNDPIVRIRCYEGRSVRSGSRADSSAIAMWAVWTVDSLYYLEEVVESVRTGPNFYAPHNPSTKAVAHLRWAAGSAITSIDLCAAVAARELGIWTGGNEFNARQLVSKRSEPLASSWPSQMLGWIDRLKSDVNYPIILAARHPLTRSINPSLYHGGPIHSRRYKRYPIHNRRPDNNGPETRH
jgi:hypothetical protein